MKRSLIHAVDKPVAANQKTVTAICGDRTTPDRVSTLRVTCVGCRAILVTRLQEAREEDVEWDLRR